MNERKKLVGVVTAVPSASVAWQLWMAVRSMGASAPVPSSANTAVAATTPTSRCGGLTRQTPLTSSRFIVSLAVSNADEIPRSRTNVSRDPRAMTAGTSVSVVAILNELAVHDDLVVDDEPVEALRARRRIGIEVTRRRVGSGEHADFHRVRHR